MRSFPTLVVALIGLLLAGAAPADAAKPKKVPDLKPVSGMLQARIGIADQKSDLFLDPRFRGLGLKLARRSVAWDYMKHDWQIAEMDEWLGAARFAGATPVITFARSRTNRRSVPTAAQIRTAFVQFRQRWPWVKEFVASNESNHFGEPTGRRPKLAAQHYKAMRRVCPTCKIGAATLLDQPNLVSWARAFIKAAGEQPKYWALHNYISANRFDDTRTKQLLRAVKGQIWLTEVGGLVKRRTPDRPGKVKLEEGVSHAARVTRYIFNELTRVSPRITRIYVYHWNAGGPDATWDSGLIAADGRPRAAYAELQRFLRGSRRGSTKKLGKARPKTTGKARPKTTGKARPKTTGKARPKTGGKARPKK